MRIDRCDGVTLTTESETALQGSYDQFHPVIPQYENIIASMFRHRIAGGLTRCGTTPKRCETSQVLWSTGLYRHITYARYEDLEIVDGSPG